MTLRTLRRCGWAALLVWISAQAIAAGPPPGEPSPELRARMAAAHQKMADCLKSSRPIAECRAEMRESCRGMMHPAPEPKK